MRPCRRAFVFAILAATLFAACDTGSGSPALEIGVSRCSHCASVIEDQSWAAADRKDGAFRLYEDPGCLLAVLAADGSSTSTARFQDRSGSGSWLPGGDVWLARSNDFQSPNGSGWAAYPSFAAAQEAVTAAGSGEIVRLPEAVKAAASSR